MCSILREWKWGNPIEKSIFYGHIILWKFVFLFWLQCSGLLPVWAVHIQSRNRTQCEQRVLYFTKREKPKHITHFTENEWDMVLIYVILYSVYFVYFFWFFVFLYFCIIYITAFIKKNCSCYIGDFICFAFSRANFVAFVYVTSQIVSYYFVGLY